MFSSGFALAAEDVAPYGAPAPANEPAKQDPQLQPLSAWSGSPWPTPEAFWPILPPTNGTFWRFHQGDRATFLIEGLLARAAHAEAALELAIGKGLLLMQRRNRLEQFALTNIHDYAREKLGLGRELVRKRLRLARYCRTRPLLDAALRAGEVKLRAAELVASLAKGDEEAAWVEKAKTMETRALTRAVRDAREEKARAAGAEPLPDPDDPEPWVTFSVVLGDTGYEVVERALAAAAHHLGCQPDAPACLEALAQEFLGHAAPPQGPDAPRGLCRSMFVPRPRAATTVRPRPELDLALVRDLELALDVVEAPQFPVPENLPDDAAALELHARLLELTAMRTSWDRVLGHLAECVRTTRLWHRMGYASFDHYCEQRLGLPARTVETRCAVERRLWGTPELRQARDSGLGFEKVRCLSRLGQLEIPAWAEKARGLTVIQLQRALHQKELRQMRTACRFKRRLPLEVAEVLTDALRAVRQRMRDPHDFLGDGACLALLAAHFLDTWWETLPRRKTRSQQVRERDGGFCTVPMCSKPSGHSHHIEFRSQGGSNAKENQTGLCDGHHLHFLHDAGVLKVEGTAPDHLTWTLNGEVWTGPTEPPVAWRPRT